MNDIFKDRLEAGELLGKELLKKFGQIENGIVLALPRGGVIIASKVAEILRLPLDLVITRKIGAPGNPEYAIAAVSENELVINHPDFIDDKYIEATIESERLEIERRYKVYRGDIPPLDLASKTVFLIDDGLATGLTMMVAIKEIKKQRPKKIIVSVPVAPPDTAEEISKNVDEMVILKIEPRFFAVGSFYEDFSQVSDHEVKNILNKFH